MKSRFPFHPVALMRDGLKALQAAQERQQPEKVLTRYTYSNGPMFYLGQQIVRVMHRAGRPSEIYEALRTPEEQDAAYVRGASKARRWQSPHQFWEAVDILHPSLKWKVTDEYWDGLADAVSIVEDRFGVKLVHGWRDWGWDGPHVQLADWKTVRARGLRVPTQSELDERFKQVLPAVWQQHLRSTSKSRG